MRSDIKYRLSHGCLHLFSICFKLYTCYNMMQRLQCTACHRNRGNLDFFQKCTKKRLNSSGARWGSHPTCWRRQVLCFLHVMHQSARETYSQAATLGGSSPASHAFMSVNDAFFFFPKKSKNNFFGLRIYGLKQYQHELTLKTKKVTTDLVNLTRIYLCLYQVKTTGFLKIVGCG